MNSYIITGGAGFIGSYLTERLVNDGHKVTIVDDLSNGSIKNLSSVINKINIVSKNLLRISQEDFQTERIDGIFHLATHPRSFSFADPYQNIEVNCKGMISALELARKLESKVVFTSNSGLLGDPQKLPMDEEHPVNPKTPYDANKLVSEYYCRMYHITYGVRSVIFRLATVFGARQAINPNLNWRPLVATLLDDIINDRRPTIAGNGKQTRDLIYVKDVVNALILGMNSRYGDARIYHLGTEHQTSVLDVYNIISKLTGKYVQPIFVDPLPNDLQAMCVSYKRANEELGFSPAYTIEEAIQEMINIAKNRQDK